MGRERDENDRIRRSSRERSRERRDRHEDGGRDSRRRRHSSEERKRDYDRTLEKKEKESEKDASPEAPRVIDHSEVDVEQEAILMAQMLGLNGFTSTTGQKVAGNEVGAHARKSKLTMTQRGNQKNNATRTYAKRR